MVEGRIELNSGETNDTEPRPTEEDSLSRAQTPESPRVGGLAAAAHDSPIPR
jgi:hypothetical protein